MSVWIGNLKAAIEDRPVIVLHGNVRDRYIDSDGRVYNNLTELLKEIVRGLPMPFSETVFYDTVGMERRVGAAQPQPERGAGEAQDDLDGTAPDRTQQPAQRDTPARVLERWLRQATQPDRNTMMVLYYLDKLIGYKTSYQTEESDVLLRLEKLIENILPNHRLIMVALQDTLVPIELYTNSPKTYVLPIVMPDKEDRVAYLKHRLGEMPDRLGLVADLTDGLFLRDLDNIATDLAEQGEMSTRDLHRLVNKYRIGERQDYWGTLSIEKLDDAARWFVEDEGVKGQDESIHKVVDMLCLARAGLSGVASGTSSKPKGVLFFAGPTGVGKTFVAKKLAKFLFSTEEAFLRFDMSEYKEEHTVSKLIGSPPGYVGYERGGLLTNAVRQRPFSVILFDEIEKAHPKIMDVFLQILDEGRLTDSRGQTVFFTETVIIFTSNLGTRTTDSRGAPVDERADLDPIVAAEGMDHEEKKRRIREHFTRAVERFFTYEISRPELLNRIGNNIVPFNYIHSPEVQGQIVASHLKRIKEEFEDRYRTAGHQLTFDASVPAFLVAKHGKQMNLFGGRGVTNAIEDEVMKLLAFRVLRAEHDRHQHVKFRLTVTQDGRQLAMTTD
jgi:DNA polymerase III delta prime subunit